MGVVHKLKEEVITYILNQKKDNPKLSCRKIADLVHEKFQVSVSKSSVNAILKDANLSSSVGRPTGIKLPKKFTIPKEKKTQLLNNLPKEGLVSEEAGQEKPPQPKPKAKPKKPKDKKKDLKESIGQFLDEGEASVIHEAEVKEQKSQDIEKHKVKVSLEEFNRQVQTIRDHRAAHPGKIYDGLGMAFLKCLQWELADHPLSDHFDVYGEFLVYLKTLNKDPVQLEQLTDHAIFPLHGFSPSKVTAESFGWLKSYKKPESLLFDYENELVQMFSFVRGFKLECADKTEFFMSALTNYVCNEPTELSGSYPLNKCLTVLSSDLISNRRAMVLFQPPGQSLHDQEFKQFVSMCEQASAQSIKSISVLDHEDKVVTTFSTIPDKKRAFVLGITPEQKEFQDLLPQQATVQDRMPYYDELLDEVFYYAPVKLDAIVEPLEFQDKALQGYFLWGESHPAPCVLLITNHDELTEDLVRTFVRRWPNTNFLQKKDEMAPMSLSDQQRHFKENDADMGWIFEHLGDQMMNYYHHVAAHLVGSDVDVTSFMVSIYNLPGYFQEHDQWLWYSLKLPEGFEHKQSLMRMIGGLNARDLRDPLGRKVFIRIEK